MGWVQRWHCMHTAVLSPIATTAEESSRYLFLLPSFLSSVRCQAQHSTAWPQPLARPPQRKRQVRICMISWVYCAGTDDGLAGRLDLTEDQKTEIRQAFELFDNGTGVIEAKELKVSCEWLKER
jgi:hypothetical protein